VKRFAAVVEGDREQSHWVARLRAKLSRVSGRSHCCHFELNTSFAAGVPIFNSRVELFTQFSPAHLISRSAPRRQSNVPESVMAESQRLIEKLILAAMPRGKFMKLADVAMSLKPSLGEVSAEEIAPIVRSIAREGGLQQGKPDLRGNSEYLLPTLS